MTLVGGGGKTTLLHELYRLYRSAGLRVALTTSCKMGLDPRFISDPGQILRAAEAGGCHIGRQVDAHHVEGLGEAALEELLPLFDLVLIEGDGAKRLPVKVPLPHEPVIYGFSDLSLVVAGLSALGQPLAEACFRLEEALRLTGAHADQLIDAGLLAQLIAKGYLCNPALEAHMGRKAMVLLNQCDSLRRLNACVRLRGMLPAPVLATNDRQHGSPQGERWWLG